MQTHSSAFRFKLADVVTTHDIVALCEKVETKLGRGYKCRPEAIFEGGLQFVEWPEAAVPPPQEAYKHFDNLKTIRFRLDGIGNNGAWPRIQEPDRSRQEWAEKRAQTIWAYGEGLTVIKAFGRAPAWTPKELKAVREALNELGWKCGAIPRSTKYDYRRIFAS